MTATTSAADPRPRGDAQAEDWQEWRPAPLLPTQDGRDRALTFVVAALCFLACIGLFAMLASNRAASGWRRELSASATVQVRPKAGETGSEAAARAAEALAGVRGVQEAEALDRAAAEKLLEPWLGKGNIPDDLPIPHLVTVELDPAHPASVADLNAALSAGGVDATVDDHSRWIRDVQASGAAVRAIGLVAAALVAAAAGAVIAFATRAGLAARRDVVEVLHLSGAKDRYIAGLFQRRFAFLAARAGGYGALVAIVLAGLLRGFGGADGFTPVLPLAWSDLLAAVPCPLAAALVAAVAARRTAMTILGQAT
jgi:cell division transport system permease protein